jgi:hypothetical protein
MAATDVEMLDERITDIVRAIRERYLLDTPTAESEHGLTLILKVYDQIFGTEFSPRSAADLKIPLYNENAWIRARVVESRAIDGIIPKPVHIEATRAYNVLHGVRRLFLAARHIETVLAPGFLQQVAPASDSEEYYESIVFRAEEAVAHAGRELGINLPEDAFHWTFTPSKDPTVDDNVKLSPFQSLLTSLLASIEDHHYKKYENALFTRVRTPQGYLTPAYKRVCTIEHFVLNSVCRFTAHARWIEATSNAHNVKNAIEWISNCTDPAVPFLKKTERAIWAFRNGIYLMDVRGTDDDLHDAFYAYGADDFPQLENEAATKFFDVDLPWDQIENVTTIDQLPTPALCSIFDTQKYSAEEQLWIFGFLGRALVPVGVHDGWQMCIFLRGLARTGKSTIIEWLQSFFDAEDVGIVSNVQERQFGWSALVNKRLVIAPEVRADFVKSADQASLQQIISGELTSLAVKYGAPIMRKWRAPLIFAGNQDMGLDDSSGSISRRFFTVEFMYVVSSVVTDLSDTLERERPVALVKLARCYHQLRRKVGKGNVWAHAPTRFKEAQRTISEDQNSILHFLRSGSLRFSPQLFIPRHIFNNYYKIHCTSNRLQALKWTRLNYMSAFYQLALEETENIESREYRGSACKAKYILGVDLPEEIVPDASAF